MKTMTKEQFWKLIDCILDVTKLRRKYNHEKRNCETVFVKTLAAKIANEKFGLSHEKIAEYLENKPKRSAITFGLKKMREQIKLYNGYVYINLDRSVHIGKIEQLITNEYNEANNMDEQIKQAIEDYLGEKAPDDWDKNPEYKVSLIDVKQIILKYFL